MAKKTAAVPAPARKRRTKTETPAPASTPSTRAGGTSLLAAFFGVYADPHTWGALLFVLLSLVTGIIYFTLAVTGLSLSLGLLILIIGLPFALLVVIMIRGLAAGEGRLVEALLGVRVPPQPVLGEGRMSWLKRLGALVSDRHTWISFLYMVLQLPLGLLYFSIAVTFLSLGLGLIVIPISYKTWNPEGITISGRFVEPNALTLVLLVIGGFLLLTLTLHLIRLIGRLHAKYARAMLSA